MSCTYIVGDIGGTNARLQLFKISNDQSEESLGLKKYKSQNFTNLTEVVRLFFDDIELKEEDVPSVAVFALAGPITGSKAEVVNLSWRLNSELMAVELGIAHIIFINDFEACGYGTLVLPDTDLYPLSKNTEVVPNAPKAIIGAGTGLGEALIIHNGSEYVVFPGEGGHSDFCPRSKQEMDLLAFIKEKLSIYRVGVERVVSGPGIVHIYDYFCKTSPELVNTSVNDMIRSSSDPGAEITGLALSNQDRLCLEAIKSFIGSYGAEAGNAALRILPYGGLYIAGGIAPRIKELMEKCDFMENMVNKGRMRGLLDQIPVFIVLNTSVGMLGARVIAHRKLNFYSDKGQIPGKITKSLSAIDVSKQQKDSLEVPSVVVDHKPKHQGRPHKLPRVYSSQRIRRYSEEAANYKKEESFEEFSDSYFRPLLWMSVGFTISGLFAAFYHLGKVSSKPSNS